MRLRRCPIAALLLALLLPAAVRAQPQFVPPSYPGSRQATPQDIITALQNVSVPFTGGWLGTGTPANKPVMIGGVRAFTNLLNPAIANPLIATGKIGLYQHGAAMTALTPAQVIALLTLWAPTGTTPARGGGEGMAEIALFGQGGDANNPQTGPNRIGLWGGRYPVETVSIPATITGEPVGSYTAVAGEVHPGQVYGSYLDGPGLIDFERGIDAAIASGASNVAGDFTWNAGDEDLDDPFATAGFWANVRMAYQYGGGGAFDTPPSYFFFLGEPYRQELVQQIQWLTQHNLRSTVIVSPFSFAKNTDGTYHAGNDYDPALFENTIRMVGYLKAHGALPTSWTVENYQAPTLPGNANSADGTPEGLDTVALWLADNPTTTPAATSGGAAAGALAEAGLQAGPARPVVTASLAPAHAGPLSLADLSGVGTLAGQDGTDVQIDGGAINNAALSNSTLLNATITGYSPVNTVAPGVFNSILTAVGLGYTLTSTFPVSGVTLAWNLTQGGGEADLLVGPGGGGGALNIYQLNSSGTLPQPAPMPIFRISNVGSSTPVPFTASQLVSSGGATINGTLTAATANISTVAASTLNVGAVLTEPYGTPASSAAPCVTGQKLVDATYEYTCVAPNTWRRVAPASF